MLHSLSFQIQSATTTMPRIPPRSIDISEIYIDETSQNKHEYLILGGLILHKDCVDQFNSMIARARLPELPFGELKWEKVSRSKLPAYKRVVDAFFDGQAGCLPMEFHSIVVHTPDLKDDIYNKGSREIGFNKEVYQLCMKFSRLYKQRLFHIYPDERQTKSSPEELRQILNLKLRSKGDQREWPFRRIHFQNSKKVLALQVVDILIGGIAFRLNGHDQKPNASESKKDLSKHILSRARVFDAFRDTAIAGKFTIWHRRLR